MPGSRLHTAKLAAAALIAVAAGAAFLWKYLQHPDGMELLEFTTLYVAGPLAVSLLLLFSWLKRS